MIGYCSNSPRRCSKALDAELMDCPGNTCPECQFILIGNKKSALFLQNIIKMLFISIIIAAIFSFLCIAIYLRTTHV